ncbi:MAG: HAMP domain-containing sensor histidine kinase [Spirochaetia bacterium]
MRKSLFSQAFIYIFTAILLVVILLSSVFFFSIRRSVASWNVNRGQRLENLILPLLSEVYRETGTLEEVAIHHTLSPFLTSNVFAYVFDSEHNPIYIYSTGGRVPLYDEEGISSSLERLEDRSRPLTPVIGDEEIIGYLAADTVGFSHDVANRRFLNSLFSFMSWGGSIAVLVAAVSAFIFSKFLSRQTRALSVGIQKLTEGERDVDFPYPNAEEPSVLADSARLLQSRLQEEENLRRQWAEDVAHDLRTPVSALKVQLEGLAEGIFSPSPERLNSLFRETVRIESLVQDLRELNKVESPEMSLNREEFLIKPLIEQIMAQYPSKGESDSPEFVIHMNTQKCNADRHFLQRALTNVIQNAIHHGRGDGNIHINVYREGEFTVFDVSNAGKVDPVHTERFFDRLYRDSTSRTEPGAGLGLPITRAIMRSHGGDAWMEQRGERTHVFLTLLDSQEPEHPKTDTQNHE